MGEAAGDRRPEVATAEAGAPVAATEEPLVGAAVVGARPVAATAARPVAATAARPVAATAARPVAATAARPVAEAGVHQVAGTGRPPVEVTSARRTLLPARVTEGR